jgi:hypothetical protein
MCKPLGWAPVNDPNTDFRQGGLVAFSDSCYQGTGRYVPLACNQLSLLLILAQRSVVPALM